MDAHCSGTVTQPRAPPERVCGERFLGWTGLVKVLKKEKQKFSPSGRTCTRANVYKIKEDVSFLLLESKLNIFVDKTRHFIVKTTDRLIEKVIRRLKRMKAVVVAALLLKIQCTEMKIKVYVCLEKCWIFQS